MSILATIAGNVEKAFQQAKVAADPYGAALAAASDGNVSNVAQFNYFAFDYTNSNTYLDLNIKGDWLYVERGSVGTPIAYFNGQRTDSEPITLDPGRAIPIPFTRLFVEVGQPSAPGSGGGLIDTTILLSPNPRLLFIFGNGVCPFDSNISPEGASAAIPLVVPGPTLTSSQAQFTVRVPPGAFVDFSMWIQKTGMPATSAAFMPYATGGASGDYIAPDVSIYGSVVGATYPGSGSQAPTDATLLAYYRWKFRVARNCQALNFTVSEVASNTNAFAQTIAGIWGTCRVS